MTPTRLRPWASAALLTTLIAVTWASPLAMQSTHAAVTPTCDEINDLSLLGNPSEAIKAIGKIREATPVPSGAEPACAPQYATAVLREARANALVEWAGHFTRTVAETKQSDFPVNVAPAAPFDCSGSPVSENGARVSEGDAERLIGQAVKAAQTCDRHNEEAAALAKTSTLPEESNAEWTTFSKTQLEPWVPIFVAFLVWGTFVIAGARLLLLLLGRPLSLGKRSIAWMSRALWRRRMSIAVGWSALVLSCATAVGLISMVHAQIGGQLALRALLAAVGVLVLGFGLLLPRLRSVSRLGLLAGGCLLLIGAAVSRSDLSSSSVAFNGPLTPHLWWGGLFAAIAALGLVLGWGAGPRLTITATGDASVPSAQYLRSLIMQLGASPPRGLEVPSGTDADFIKSVGIIETASNPLVSALARLIQLSRAPTPWQMVVTAHSKDVMTAELTHNHGVVASGTIDRSVLFKSLDVPGTTSKPAEFDLAPFPAAFAVLRIAVAHGIAEGLAGASQWQSIGLQYLGARQPRADATGRALFASAVATDQENMLAQVGYWNALYREADDAEKLSAYLLLLNRALASGVLKDEPTLRLRALYSSVAVGINLISCGGVDGTLVERARRLLREASESLPESAEPFRLDLQRSARVLVQSVPELRGTQSPGEPESNPSGINYSWACFFATNGHSYDEAVRFLRLADESPKLASWRKRDPQLLSFRRSTEYRTAFGDSVPRDILSVAPFSDCAKRLRAGGFTTLERIGEANESALMAAGLKRPTATWLRQLADLGLSIPDDLREWRVPIVATFAELGVVTKPTSAKERAVLRDAILAACGRLKTSPNHARLDAFLLPTPEPEPEADENLPVRTI